MRNGCRPIAVAMLLAAAGYAALAQPIITNQPQCQAVAPGATGTFIVGARGTSPLAYQWQSNLGAGFADLAGCTNALLVLTNAQSWDAGDYRVVLTNSSGARTSVVAHLYVVRFAPASTTLLADNFDDNTNTTWGTWSLYGYGRVRETNAQLTVSGSWPGQATRYPWDTLAEARINKTWSVAEGQCVEFRADLVSISENTTNLAMFEIYLDTPNVYTFAKGRDWIRIGKGSSAGSIGFWCEKAAIRNTNVILSFALTKAAPNVILTGRVLDKENPGVVLYQHSVVDTPGVDPTFTPAQISEITGINAIQAADDASPPSASGMMVGIGVLQYTDGHQPGAQVTYDNFEIREYEPVFTRYVDANSPNPTPPYTNWATAAWTIQEAVDAAKSGDTVVVTNGVYGIGGWTNQFGSGRSRVAITNSIRLESVNGPSVTMIEGGGDGEWIRCVNLCAEAVVSGFTLTKGRAAGEGAGVDAYASQGRGVLTNCILTGNMSAISGGGACAVLLYNCTLVGNSAMYGGGVSGGVLYNCTLTRNSAVDNHGYGGVGGGALESELHNCSVVDNSASSIGGGVVNSTLLNCIVAYNTAPVDPNYEGGEGALWMEYCCTSPLPTWGRCNITNAALFVDYTNGNLRLQSNSPCINAGNNSYVSGTTDLDGKARIAGGTVDIGAYEYQDSSSVISYAWLQRYGFPTDGSADYLDPDHDGMNNWQEWRCGTDPTNAFSVLRLLSPSITSTNVTVTWQSVAGVNYFLERTANLGSPFTLWATNITGQAGTTTFTDTNAASLAPLFYRVGVGK